MHIYTRMYINIYKLIQKYVPGKLLVLKYFSTCFNLKKSALGIYKVKNHEECIFFIYLFVFYKHLMFLT